MTTEQKLHIKQLIESMQTRENLLEVLNQIKSYELGERAIPFSLRQLLYHCNPKLNSRRYIVFKIPKKSGEKRVLMAPNNGLKMLQFCVNKMLQLLYVPNDNVCGFVEGKSIVDGARMHINHKYVLNLDLKDFFPSIDQARIWKRLQYPPFNFTQEVASIIAGLCCHPMLVDRQIEGEIKKVVRSVLPQGAPTSPILTNIICQRLDRRLQGVAKRFGVVYSRYADDITFSSNHYVYKENDTFRKEVERIIREQNFRLNADKTRLQGCAIRQEVTGLIISDKVNTPRKYVKQLRIWLHYWETYGYDKASSIIKGYYHRTRGKKSKGEMHIENVIGGKLDFLKMVKGVDDSTYRKLNRRYMALVNCKDSDIVDQLNDNLSSLINNELDG